MPFNHNDHYHRLLLRQIPRDCARALDVGCGTGRFARLLAGMGIDVDAIDKSGDVIAEARALTPRGAGARSPRFQQADVTRLHLPGQHYGFICCLASIHHMPFETVTTLRQALTPGGVLAILGCYPATTLSDWAWSLAAVPVNAAARLAAAAPATVRPAPPANQPRAMAPVAQPAVPLPELRRQAAALLPGCRIRRLLFFRYLLLFRNGS
jgi:SAM-dependent methyltransferase